MTVAILKYNAGNTTSVAFALARLGADAICTDNIVELRRADKVIIPGVGAARPAMQYLEERELDQIVKNLTQPVLGICLGLQILCSSSEEDEVDCLGVFETTCERFRTPRKIPHMGWNLLTDLSGPLFSEIDPLSAYVYFVHSYRAPVCADAAALCAHGEQFSAALQKENFYAVQFHPEKSGEVGHQVLKNFLSI
ncbi:MAG: imidazole glycerol phosphate synthase subunit HisH [Bdellovibrionales bacterium]|nr:imidazole glycerol phosphate synthase subunit HisH [Bdellovibrionales bacterium]